MRIPWRVLISILTHEMEMLQVQPFPWKTKKLIATDSVPAGKTLKQFWFCRSVLSELGAIESNEEISGNLVLLVAEA